MTSNSLLKTLLIIEALSDWQTSSKDLSKNFFISVASVKRHVSEARELGADIRSVRSKDGWMYELRNADAVMALTRIWIDLETQRDLTTTSRQWPSFS